MPPVGLAEHTYFEQRLSERDRREAHSAPGCTAARSDSRSDSLGIDPSCSEAADSGTSAAVAAAADVELF